MERIRKALDIAQLERSRPVGARVETLIRPAEAPKPSDTLRPAEPVRPAEKKAVTSTPARVEYSRTKTFSPSAELLEANRILEPAGSTPAAAAFRMLRTQVLQRMNEHQWRSIAVLSPGSEDGKTTTAINLAVSLASDHRHTVLLVEFDLKKPCIAKLLGISPDTGADDLLRGDADLQDCLYHPKGFDRLVVLPARAAMRDSSEVLAGPWCREIVMQLRSRYPDRLLVFDLPPVLGADDALAFVPLVECALVVVAEGSTRREDLLNCMELLRKTPVVGTVLNRASHVATPYRR